MSNIKKKYITSFQSREERKMEMIMKAFEAMERAEQRRKESVSEGREEKAVTPGIGGPKRRRRSSSSFKMMANADSNLDVSSADESKPEPKRTKRKGRKSGPTTPQRRRSRILSGGTASALSTDEDHVTGNAGGSQEASSAPSGLSGGGPFRFPKTKKSLMTDWLQESSDTAVSHMQNDDDVSANYLRGSRSPPGIATHLLRSSAPLSPVKNVCSAKKRWLRQAISEDHTDDGPVNGNASPSSEACYVDYVTPLKKRRLASYKDDQDHNSDSSSRMPNGLKNKLLSNMVLEAVLDRALEDMGGSVARSASVDSMASPAAESSMSIRSPDQSPAKELQSEDACSSRDAYPDESPDLKHDEEEEATFEEEEFVHSRHQEPEDEDEQVEVEETSSNVGDEEEEVSQQSQDVDEELAEVSKEDVDDDDEAEEDVEVEEEQEVESKFLEAADTLDDDANFAQSSKDDFEDDNKDEEEQQHQPQQHQQHQQEFQPLDEDARQESPEEEEKNSSKERDVSSEDSSQNAAPQSQSTTNSKMSVTPIKTPEPSSVFKSFFTSNVSLEELEAEIEASKKARLVEDQKPPPVHILTGESFLHEQQASLPNCEPMSDVSFASTASVPDEASEQLGRMSVDRRDSETSTVESVKDTYHHHVQSNFEDQTTATNLESTPKTKPKEKKRFSLADYKKRRQTEGISMQTETSASNRVDDRDGPGTPTQDEELATLAAPTTLNTLPLFEKLIKLEKAQKESKKKGKFRSYYVIFNF